MKTVISAAAAVLAAAGCLLAAHPGATAPRCPDTPAQSCIRVPANGGIGQEITAGSRVPGTPWMVTDKTGAPMAWVNLFGLYSGGDGGKMPGGLICVTNGVLRMVACLTPVGTLQLGRPGQPLVTLTPADIRFLHRLERVRARHR